MHDELGLSIQNAKEIEVIRFRYHVARPLYKGSDVKEAIRNFWDSRKEYDDYGEAYTDIKVDGESMSIPDIVDLEMFLDRHKEEFGLEDYEGGRW